MAAREKTRDELDMQTLRELAALPPNKFCFDCGQRGTTYVNVTIGAFVCSTCGGLLRGLNPPHRVKSLTVCSFTEVEMDRLKSRGNEYCTHIWLGKYDTKSPDADLVSSDQRREFMIQKYEEKKYYVDPREAIKKMKPRAPAVPTTTTTATTANTSVPRSYTAIPKQTPRVQSSGVFPQTFSAGDIRKNSVPDAFTDDPFKSDPFRETKPGENAVDGASFADFNSAFGGDSGSSSPAQAANSTAQSVSSHKKPAPPPPDRYAALADLDSQHHQQAAPPDVPAAPIPSVIIASNAPGPFWQPPAITGAVYAPPTINPFQHGAVPTWQQAVPNPFQGVNPQIPVGTGVLQQQNLNGMPKPSLHNGGAYWSPASNTAAWGGHLYPNTQPDPFLMNSAPVDSYNPWAQSFGASGANPFGTNSFVPGQPSSIPQTNAKKNPFL